MKIISTKTSVSIASAVLWKSKMIKSKSSKRRSAPVRSYRCGKRQRLPFILSAPRVGALKG